MNLPSPLNDYVRLQLDALGLEAAFSAKDYPFKGEIKDVLSSLRGLRQAALLAGFAAFFVAVVVGSLLTPDSSVFRFLIAVASFLLGVLTYLLGSYFLIKGDVDALRSYLDAEPSLVEQAFLADLGIDIPEHATRKDFLALYADFLSPSETEKSTPPPPSAPVGWWILELGVFLGILIPSAGLLFFSFIDFNAGSSDNPFTDVCCYYTDGIELSRFLGPAWQELIGVVLFRPYYQVTLIGVGGILLAWLADRVLALFANAIMLGDTRAVHSHK